MTRPRVSFVSLGMHVHLASAVNTGNWSEPEQAPHIEKRACIAHMCVDISLIPRPEKEEEKEPGNKASVYICLLVAIYHKF